MIYLLKAAFPTMGVILYERFYRKEKKNPFIYICIFLAMALSFYVLDSHLCAKEVIDYDCKLTYTQRQYYWKLIHEHYEKAWSCSYEAESGCTNIPHKIYRASAKAATAAITAGVISRNITSAAIAAATAGLQDILEQFGDTWKNISYNLHCAEYHIEMAEFYQDVLAADG